MSEEPMTLLERLRNPQWIHHGRDIDPVLDAAQTRKDMNEAADAIESLARMAAKYLTHEALRVAGELPSQHEEK